MYRYPWSERDTAPSNANQQHSALDPCGAHLAFPVDCTRSTKQQLCVHFWGVPLFIPAYTQSLLVRTKPCRRIVANVSLMQTLACTNTTSIVKPWANRVAISFPHCPCRTTPYSLDCRKCIDRRAAAGSMSRRVIDNVKSKIQECLQDKASIRDG